MCRLDEFPQWLRLLCTSRARKDVRDEIGIPWETEIRMQSVENQRDVIAYVVQEAHRSGALAQFLQRLLPVEYCMWSFLLFSLSICK